MRPLYYFVVLPASIFTFASAAAAQGAFTRIGKPDTYLSDISADGSIAVGVRSNSGPVFRWTATEGAVDIGASGSTAAISRDGKTIVSDAKDLQGVTSAAVWQGGTNWKLLGGVPNGRPLDQSLSTAYGVSADGSVVVGLAWVTSGKAHGFRWDAGKGMVDLGSLQNDSSRVNAVSADGNVIVGWDANPLPSEYNYWRGAVWWQGLERLLNPFGWIGQAESTNNNGSVIVGRGHPSAYRHAYRFTAWDGHFEELGALSRGLTPDQKEQEDTSIAYAVSDDGNVVVGTSGSMPPLDAFVWTPETQMVKLATYLADRGVTGLGGWRLLMANSVSPNGKIIAGTGINPAGFAEGWIARLP
jgi:probable HAF family extracellular repeat protein